MLSTRIKRLYGFQHSRVVLCIQISDFSTWITSLYWSQPSSLGFAFKTATFGPAYKSLWVPDITCRFVHEKQRDQQLNYLSLCVPALISGFCMQNSAFWTRITSLHRSQTKSVVLSTHNWVLSTRIKGLYWFQPSPVVLCIQISDFSTWITSLYWSQPSSVVFAFKTATFGAILQVSIEPRPHLSFCACKTAWLASELLVSIGPSPHLWFSYSKQRIMDQNY